MKVVINSTKRTEENARREENYTQEIKKLADIKINFTKDEVEQSKQRYSLYDFLLRRYCGRVKIIISELVKASFKNDLNLMKSTKYIIKEYDYFAPNHSEVLRTVRYTLSMTNGESESSYDGYYYCPPARFSNTFFWIDLLNKDFAYQNSTYRKEFVYPFFSFSHDLNENGIKLLLQDISKEELKSYNFIQRFLINVSQFFSSFPFPTKI